MDRVILHCDMNNFYASVECLHNPSLADKAVAVCGNVELRHGIVLSKNNLAKSCGVKTGEAIWEAKVKCPNLVVVAANFSEYLRYSQMARNIYERYTDRIESFGIDECWLDVTASTGLFGNGEKIANEIRQAIKYELGCTVSIGVSWNKIFAKLGSDMKKPDATTVISKENYKNLVFGLPAQELLYVGRATQKKLNKCNINTIGDIANTDVSFLKSFLGKAGECLWTYANGYDMSQVRMGGEHSQAKSVGNSTTTARDLLNRHDVLMVVTVMSESVATRMREQWLKGRVISLYIRDNKLNCWGKQMKIEQPTFLSSVIISTAMKLFDTYDMQQPIRSIGVTVSDLSTADSSRQLNMFLQQEEKAETLEITIDSIRQRFGHDAIKRATVYVDERLTDMNPKEDNVSAFSFFK